MIVTARSPIANQEVKTTDPTDGEMQVVKLSRKQRKVYAARMPIQIFNEEDPNATIDGGIII